MDLQTAAGLLSRAENRLQGDTQKGYWRTLDKKFLSLKKDLISKKVFGDNKDILIDLLKPILKLPNEEYETLTILDPHTRVMHGADKYSIMDLQVKTKSGITVIVEWQGWRDYFIANRTLYYQSRVTSSQLRKKQPYRLLKPVVTVAILDYNLFSTALVDTELPYVDQEPFHFHFTLFDERKKVHMTKLLEFHFLELPKLKYVTEETELTQMLSVINAESYEELDMIQTTSEKVKRMIEAVRLVNMDDETRYLYEQREKAERDYLSGLDGYYQLGEEAGVEKGKAAGKLEGKIEATQEIASNFLNLGLPNEQVSIATGLSLTEIQELKKKL